MLPLNSKIPSHLTTHFSNILTKYSYCPLVEDCPPKMTNPS